METISDLLISTAPQVHYISFFLLALAGFNLPISEDLVFIVSASIAATIVPENTIYVFIGCFLGAYVSDIIAYLIGKYAGNRLVHSPFFKRHIPTHKIVKIEHYYLKYGGKTLFFGRFIPFGVRNVIFLTSGFVHLPIMKFLLIDLSALVITSTILFSLGYAFGSNYEIIIGYLNQYKIIIFGIFIIFLAFLYFRHRKSKEENTIQENT